MRNAKAVIKTAFQSRSACEKPKQHRNTAVATIMLWKYIAKETGKPIHMSALNQRKSLRD